MQRKQSTKKGMSIYKYCSKLNVYLIRSFIEMQRVIKKLVGRGNLWKVEQGADNPATEFTLGKSEQKIKQANVTV